MMLEHKRSLSSIDLERFHKTILVFACEDRNDSLDVLMLWHLQQERELYETIAVNMVHKHYTILRRNVDDIPIPKHITIDEINESSDNTFLMQIKTLKLAKEKEAKEIWFDNAKSNFWVKLYGKFKGIKIKYPLAGMGYDDKIEFLKNTALLPDGLIRSVLMLKEYDKEKDETYAELFKDAEGSGIELVTEQKYKEFMKSFNPYDKKYQEESKIIIQ